MVERSELQKLSAENQELWEKIIKIEAAQKATTEGAETLVRLQQTDPAALTQLLEALKIVKS